MISSKSLKIWTILTHAFIVVGFGHGIITFGLIELIYPFFVNAKPSFSLLLTASFESRMLMVGLTSFIGQVFLVYSMLSKRKTVIMATHIAGLIMFWLSILYFVGYSIESDNSVHFYILTAIPFGICTVIAFTGRPIKNLYYRVLDI